MMKAFKMSDIDGDDLLSSEEVKALLKNFNEEFTDEEIDESIKAADKGGLISEGILPLVPLPKKGAKSLSSEQKIGISCLLKNFVFRRDLTPFDGNEGMR